MAGQLVKSPPCQRTLESKAGKKSQHAMPLSERLSQIQTHTKSLDAMSPRDLSPLPAPSSPPLHNHQ